MNFANKIDVRLKICQKPFCFVTLIDTVKVIDTVNQPKKRIWPIHCFISSSVTLQFLLQLDSLRRETTLIPTIQNFFLALRKA